MDIVYRSRECDLGPSKINYPDKGRGNYRIVNTGSINGSRSTLLLQNRCADLCKQA
jgi:hypothetical protein